MVVNQRLFPPDPAKQAELPGKAVPCPLAFLLVCRTVKIQETR